MQCQKVVPNFKRKTANTVLKWPLTKSPKNFSCAIFHFLGTNDEVNILRWGIQHSILNDANNCIQIRSQKPEPEML